MGAKYMFKRRVLALVVVAVALTLMPLANLAYAQDPTATPRPTATPVIGDFGKGGTQLTFWDGLTGGDGSVMAKMVEQFAKDNPDISIHRESYEWGVMFQKLTAAFVAGEPPDVFVLHTQEIPQFAKLGILRESEDMLDTGGGSLPAKDYSGLNATVYNGKHYGILLDNHGFGTYVNLNLLKAAGLPEDTPMPKNADEFIKLATKLTIDANGKHPDEAGFDVKNVKQWGTGIDWLRVQFEAWLPQFGGSLISADGKKATINEAPGKQTLQFMMDMVNKYHISPNRATVNGYDIFQAGQVAILPSGTWFRNQLVEQHPEIKFTAWPMIQVSSKPATWASAHVLFIASTLEGPKLDAAKKFITYLSNNDALWATSGHVPARISSQSKLDPNVYKSNVVFGKSFQEYAVFELPHVASTELTNAYDPELSAAMSGQKTVDQALDDAAKRMQAILDRPQQ